MPCEVVCAVSRAWWGPFRGVRSLSRGASASRWRLDGARVAGQPVVSPRRCPVTKPFLILQLRPETEAADDEYAAILRKGGLEAARTHRIRLDQQDLPPDLRLADYAGVIVGGGPGCVSDAPEDKTPQEARIEVAVLSLMPRITGEDIPFLGCCYGIGILGKHLGGNVSKRAHGEPVGTADCTVAPEAGDDPLLEGIPGRFADLPLPDGAAWRECLRDAVSPRGRCRRVRDAHPHLSAQGLFPARDRR